MPAEVLQIKKQKMNNKYIQLLSRIRLTGALILFLGASLTAQKYDYNWVLGMHEFPGLAGFNNVILHFSDQGVDIEETDLKMNFESTAVSMSDSLGHLIFYSNGCYVADVDGNPMSGGLELNPGEIHDWVCDKAGYIAPKGAMAVKMPGSTNTYLLMHMGGRYDPAKKIKFGPLYYSVIDMALNGGKGAVTSVNNILTDGNLEPFSATRHGNGRDWWIVVPVYGGSEYRSFLVTPNAILGPFMQQIGSTMNCRSIGTSAFSLDGSKFVRTQNCQVATFDFDRCSGVFSNPTLLDLPNHLVGGGGAAFSPDNQRLIFCSQLQIFEANLSEAFPRLDSSFLWNYQWAVSLQNMQYSPNGQILMSHMHRTNYLSTIEYPSEKGANMSFKPKGLSLPVFSVRSLPNNPNYRLFDLPDSPCDTLGINSPMVNTTILNSELTNKLLISPSPSTSEVLVSIQAQEKGTWALVDLSGKTILSGNWNGTSKVLNLGGMPRGIYFFLLKINNGKILRGKLILI